MHSLVFKFFGVLFAVIAVTGLPANFYDPYQCTGTGNVIKATAKHYNYYDMAGTRKMVVAYAIEAPDPTHIKPDVTNAQRAAVQEVLGLWENKTGAEERTNAGTIIPKDSNNMMRLNLQATFNTVNYGLFMNYQVQINNPKDAAGPTTVAQAHVQYYGNMKSYEGLGYRRLVAFILNQSLKEHAKVWMFQGEIATDTVKLACPIHIN